MRLTNQQRQLVDGLPGGDLIISGLQRIANGDYAAIESLLVFLAIPRMSKSGFPELEKQRFHAPNEIEQNLYRALSHDDDAYGEYNALKNRLASFLSALENRWSRENRTALTR